MKRSILALLLVFCMLFLSVPVFAGTDTEQQVYAQTATVTAGNMVTVYVMAKNFSSVAVMDIYVYYDPQVFTVDGTSNGSMLSGAQASVNTKEIGTVKLSAMSLDGINGSGDLLMIRFSVSGDCKPGTYPISVAVGRAHHADLSTATIDSADGTVTVNAPTVSAETFSLYGYSDKYTLKQGETLSYRVASQSSSRAFVSGDFTFIYDHELFQFDSVELEAALVGDGAVYSVNSSVLGKVRIVYASENPVATNYLFKVKLTATANIDTTTTLQVQASNMYKEDLFPYLPGSASDTVTLQKKDVVVDYPNAFLRTEELILGRRSQSTFLLEAGAGVAAADFILTYDPAVLSCVGIRVDESVGANGGMVIINDNFSEGTIRFSYIHMDGYDETELPLVHITWLPLQSPQAHYKVTLNGVGVVDKSQNAMTLEYITDSNCIFVPTVCPPSCIADGYTRYSCPCGESYDGDYVPMKGHDVHQFEAKGATCTECGWADYEACSRCDYSTYEKIPALGHDEIYHDAKVATCIETGWDAYQTCSRCDYTTYKEIPKLTTHSYGNGVVTKTPTCAATGIATYTCTVCGDSYTEDIAKLTTHSYDSGVVTKAPTCAEAGIRTYTCTVCGDSYTEDIPKLTTHSYNSGVVTKAPTCAEAGIRTYTCPVCGDSYTEELSKLTDHSYVDGTCTICGGEDPDYVESTDPTEPTDPSVPTDPTEPTVPGGEKEKYGGFFAAVIAFLKKIFRILFSFLYQ